MGVFRVFLFCCYGVVDGYCSVFNRLLWYSECFYSIAMLLLGCPGWCPGCLCVVAKVLKVFLECCLSVTRVL